MHDLCSTMGTISTTNDGQHHGGAAKTKNQPGRLGGRYPSIIYKNKPRHVERSPSSSPTCTRSADTIFRRRRARPGVGFIQRRPSHLPPLQTTTRNSKRNIFSTRTAGGPTKFKIILLPPQPTRYLPLQETTLIYFRRGRRPINVHGTQRL